MEIVIVALMLYVFFLKDELQGEIDSVQGDITNVKGDIVDMQVTCLINTIPKV